MYNNKWILTVLLFTVMAFTPAPRKKLQLVFIGDSITYGAGIANNTSLAPPRFAQQYLQHHNLADEITYSNQGVSGYTTVDFLPATQKAFVHVMEAAHALHKDASGDLLFSIMLGTNDSAEEGPNGSPVDATSYYNNLKVIADSLLAVFPDAKIVIQRPIWYSPNTYNGARYLAGGLERLQSYFPVIRQLVQDYSSSNPGHVYAGDKKAFDYFKAHDKLLYQPENGRQGVFYLHPNEKGAAALGKYWGEAIKVALAK